MLLYSQIILSMEEIIMQGTIDTKELNKWLEVNVAHMKESTILTPACWYDGTDGTCSA